MTSTTDLAADLVGAEVAETRRRPRRPRCRASSPSVRPQDAHVGLHVALAVEQRRVAALARRERLDVVGELALQVLGRLRAADLKRAALGALEQRRRPRAGSRYWASSSGAIVGLHRRRRIYGVAAMILICQNLARGVSQTGVRSNRGISRRRLLAGGVRRRADPAGAPRDDSPPGPPRRARQATGPTPRRRRSRGHSLHSTDAGHATGGHAAFAPGRDVDHRANGFDPTEILRDFDYGHDPAPGQRPRPARVGAGRRRQGDRGRARRPLRGLDLQRPRARPDPALPRGRAAADPLRQRLRRTRTRCTSTASTRRSWTGCRGSASSGRRADRAGRELHLRVRRRAVRAPPLPLPRLAAGRAHRQGALRRLHRRPQGRARRRRRAGDGHERLRHQLRRRERGLRRQHGRLPLRRPTRSGSSAASSSGSTSSTSSSSTRSTRSTSTPTSSTTSRPAPRSSRASSPTRSSRARGSAGSSSCASRTRARTCSTPTRPSSPSSAGSASSRSSDGGRARRTRGGAPRRRARLWLLGLVPLLLIAAAIAVFAALGGPGLGERSGPPVEELAVERTVLRPGEIELTVRNDGARSGRDRPGRRQRRLRRRSPRDDERTIGRLGSTAAHDRLPVDRGRGLRDLAADLDRGHDRARDPGRRRDARGRRAASSA